MSKGVSAMRAQRRQAPVEMTVFASVRREGGRFVPAITVDGDARRFKSPTGTNHVNFTQAEAQDKARAFLAELRKIMFRELQAGGFITE